MSEGKYKDTGGRKQAEKGRRRAEGGRGREDEECWSGVWSSREQELRSREEKAWEGGCWRGEESRERQEGGGRKRAERRR